MKNGSPIRILVLGPDYSGKATLAGHLLYKCGKLGPEIRETLRKQKEEEGKEPNQWVESLRVQDGPTFFLQRFYRSPKYEVIIGDSASSSFFPSGHQAVCVVLLVAAAQWEFETSRDLIRKQLHFISRLGLRHLVVCVNKMDLTQPLFSRQRYDGIRKEVHSYIQDLERDGYRAGTVDFLPISALTGDNLHNTSPQTPWFAPQKIEGRAGATHTGITLHQLLCSFSCPKPSWDPASAHPDLSSDSESRASSSNSTAAQASVHNYDQHQPSCTDRLRGLGDDPSAVPPNGLGAQRGEAGVASAGGGGLGEGVPGRPSGVVARPGQAAPRPSTQEGLGKASLPPFSALWPFVKRTFSLTSAQQKEASSSSSSSWLQFPQDLGLALPCLSSQAVPEEACPGTPWSTPLASTPVEHQPPFSSHQVLPRPFQSPLGQQHHCPGLRFPPAPFMLPFQEPPPPYVPPLALPQGPPERWAPPLPYLPPPPYPHPLPHPPAPSQPQGHWPEAPQVHFPVLPPGWLPQASSPSPAAQFPLEPIAPGSLTPPSPFQLPLSLLENPPQSSP